MSSTPPVANALRLSLLSGVVSSSYFIGANLGTVFFGIVPAIQDPRGFNLSVAQKVHLWKWFYDRAKFHFGVSTMLSAISFTTAATLCPALRTLLLTTAATSFVVVPFTLFAMLPVNNQLAEMLKNRSLEDANDNGEKSTSLVQKRVAAVELLEKWRQLHLVRLALGLGAWAGGLAALLLAL